MAKTFKKSLSSKGEENRKNEVKSDNGDIHEQSIQLSNLSGMIITISSKTIGRNIKIT